MTGMESRTMAGKPEAEKGDIMNSTFIIYKTLIGTYQRLGRETAGLALKFDLAYALGRLTDEEYTELVAAVTPEAGA